MNDWFFLFSATYLQHCEAIEKAQGEIQRLRLEREHYEESMKKAFMRGVCALNMEALNMFQTAEGRPEQPAVHDQHGTQTKRDHPLFLCCCFLNLHSTYPYFYGVLTQHCYKTRKRDIIPPIECCHVLLTVV